MVTRYDTADLLCDAKWATAVALLTVAVLRLSPLKPTHVDVMELQRRARDTKKLVYTLA